MGTYPPLVLIAIATPIPSQMDQFKTGFGPRRKLDRAVRTAVGVPADEQDEIVARLERAVRELLEGRATTAKPENAAI